MDCFREARVILRDDHGKVVERYSNPDKDALNRILKYQALNDRRLQRAVTQLERLQRRRQVGVVDQFERDYSIRLLVNVDGLEKLRIELPKPPAVRGGGLYEPLDEDEQETSRREPLQRTPPAVHGRVGSVGPQGRQHTSPIKVALANKNRG